MTIFFGEKIKRDYHPFLTDYKLPSIATISDATFKTRYSDVYNLERSLNQRIPLEILANYYDGNCDVLA